MHGLPHAGGAVAVLLVLDKHNTVSAILTTQVMLSPTNKQVNRGGEFFNRSVMKARSEREGISVQLVTCTELCSMKLPGWGTQIFLGFLTTLFPLWPLHL